MQVTIKNIKRFNDGDISDEEFYKCKGLLTVFEKAKVYEIEALLRADGEEAIDTVLSFLCIKYLLKQ